MVVCYVKEFKESFVNNVEKTTKLMIPLLRFYFHEGKILFIYKLINIKYHILIFVSARTATVESLSHLLDYAKLRDDDYVRQMKKYMNKELFKGIEIEPDHQLKIRQAEAYEFDVMDMNGGPIYACACAEALPRLFTMIGAPNSCAPENITGTENAVSAVTKI
ncbi:unnamed protein product [Rotaria magnacalcarata]|uniref:Uncharacterized protein n=2 Tax=Rotaria magnacalcarata TaxID=392030 RepID=A0A820CPJ2_9BILA|nr:unnamed protein product [Rotaria magnacalcarata]